MITESLGLVAFVVVTGLIHGAEPGHGWPIAAAYAFGTDSPWSRGLAAAFVLGVGHLVSSIVVVLGFFWLKSAAGLSQVPYLDYVAGGLLIALGIREYVSGGHHHDHGASGDDEGGDGHGQGGDGHGHDHGHDGDAHGHGHDHGDETAGDDPTGLAGPADAGVSPAGVRGEGQRTDGGHSHGDHDHADGGHEHSHGAHSHGHDHDHDHGGGLRGRVLSALGLDGDRHLTAEDAAGEGIWGIAWTAFVLGFAHEEEFELIGICTGTSLCVELTLFYAASVVFALVALTALLLAGYERYEDRVERYAEHFPTVSAVVLIAMGLAFIAGVF